MSKFKTRTKKGLVIDGIINIDKPLGLSSNQALQKVKKLLQAQKAGHTGALDPLASGVLPLCFGHATKISSYLLDADKRYRATLQLGTITTTGDKEGEIVQQSPVPELSLIQLEQLLALFTGPQEQVPPMHSALKHQGQPLYKLARKGQEVERIARKIKIYSLDLLEYSSDQLKIDVKCSKGTYIRTLAEDIGQQLGCGAHLAALRRTEAGPFNLDDAYTVEQITDLISNNTCSDILLGADLALQAYPAIYLVQAQTIDIKFGRKINLLLPQIEALPAHEMETQQKYRIYDEERTFLGLGELNIEDMSKETIQLCPKRMFV